MNSIVEITYNDLTNITELNLTEKDYSTLYLGRCKSYYGYLKSTGRKASTDVLLKLWAHLSKIEKDIVLKKDNKFIFLTNLNSLKIKKEIKKMKEKVLNELLKRCINSQ